MNRDKGVSEKSKADQSDLDATFDLLAHLIAGLVPADQRIKAMNSVQHLIDGHKQNQAMAKRGKRFIEILNP